MRLRGRQGRFVAASVGGWIAARAWQLWPITPVAMVGGIAGIALLDHAPPAPFSTARPAFLAATMPRRASPPRPTAAALPPVAAARDRRGEPLYARPEQIGQAMLLAMDGGLGASPHRLMGRAAFAEATPSPPPLSRPPLPAARAARAIEASAYLFVRPGSGRATLAPGGMLGGSQIAARVAMPLASFGSIRAALAGRVYAPLAGKGAEAALGLDVRPLRGSALRLSVERRIGLDAVGRDAWSAYAAGGFYAEPRTKLVIEGYAQAGVVGLRARDPFADGALRLGRRAGRLTLGGGVWGAAQPGARRLDLGPRAAVALPISGHALTLAIEGRLRVAGRAAPGSGAALTLAADF